MKLKPQFLIERFTPVQAALVESRDSFKNLYLSGRIMAAEEKNLNQRVYPRAEIEKAVGLINEKAKDGQFVMGELNHPDNLSIDLKNVSHIIVESYMDGDAAIGKCKVLNTPSGMIVQNLIEGGVKLGVSSRGTGNVTTEGIVEDFSFVTLDIVAQPSGPGCYPDVIRESVDYMESKHKDLFDAVREDPKAQKYFKAEVMKFFEALTKKK
jgi:hypothetical protein